MILKPLLYLLLLCCLPASGFTQNFDSVSAQKPCRVEKTDTVIRFVRFHETAYTCEGKILFAGNTNKRGEKDGPWLYFTPSGGFACWGFYRKNKKTGWWHGQAQPCKIKYRKNNVSKQICT